MVELDFSFCLSENCKTFKFSETTGVYNVISNINGWNAPNEDTSTATTALVTIKDENNQSVGSVNLFSTGLFPTIDSTIISNLTSSNFNQGTNSTLTDGVYYITYSVTTPLTTIPKTKAVFLSCNVRKCVLNMFKDVIESDCSCTNDKLKNAGLAWDQYQALLSAAECGNIDQFKNYLTLINNLCDGGPCDC